MNLDLVYPAIYGLVVGTLLSFILGIYSKPTAAEYSYMLFGMSVSHLLQAMTVLLVTFTIAIYTGFSMLIRDLKYPNEHPWKFTGELLLAALIPASFFVVMMYLRGKPFSSSTYVEFTVLSMKFALAHILLQFSGVYASVFNL